MNPDTVIVLFVEGDTENEFYKTLVHFLHNICGTKFNCFIEYQILKGVGNFCTKAERILRKDLMQRPKYKKLPFKVLLCYDTDVFDRNENKVKINWHEIEKTLLDIGVSEVFHIRATSSIEDWFLADPNGIKNFLGITKSADISKYKGLSGLKRLFSENGKRYAKGVKCEGLVSELDLSIILNSYCKQIHHLCRILDIPCDHNGKCIKSKQE